MNRRVVLVALACVVLVGGGVALRPRWMKMRTRHALEQAASNVCACMLGRHGDVDAGLLAVRAGLVAKPERADRAWPGRCESWGEEAFAAYVVASRWDDLDYTDGPWSSASFLKALQPFWVRDPDTRVPIPEPGAFALTEDELQAITDGSELGVRIASDGLEVGASLRIDRDDRLEHVEHVARAFPGHPKWRAIDGEAGAKTFWTEDGHFYDEAGHVLGSDEFMSLVFARAFADGRLVAHVYVPTLDRDFGEIWEYTPDKKLKRARFERSVPFGSKSTTSVDEWMLYKHVDEKTASIAAIDFSRGASAAPIMLGPVEKTSSVLGRSYGTCRAHGTFVDMDPSFLIRTATGWKYVDLQQPAHRTVTCEGDVAMVTEWMPLEIRKCTTEGCTLVAFPGLSAGPDDEFAADEHHVFRVVRQDGAIGVHVYAFDHPSDVRHVPLLPRARQVQIRAVAGRAIVFVQKGDGWAAISVRPDGAVRAIGPT